jgi:adenine-specific DNA-methyltransferase
MIKYLGSKRVLLPTILETIRALPGVSTVVDPFSGTARVGHALKRAGYRVFASDCNAYAHVLATCYVRADALEHARDAQRLIGEFNALSGSPGYVTETFCERSRYFHPKNGERIDAIREAIARKDLSPELEAVVLVSLMEAADRVDSTTGVQMAYLKKWAARAHNDLRLRLPDLVERPTAGKCSAARLDALEAVHAWSDEADVVYLDPPYNQHSYLGNYHVWESLVTWDKPEVYGVACKRVDCRERRSRFNSKRQFREAMEELLDAVKSRYLVVSFNNEGYLSRGEMESMLAARFGGEDRVVVIERDYKRYVGAQIGIHNLRGEQVGAVSHLRNKEFLYVASREGSLEALRGLLLEEPPAQAELFAR